MNKQLLLSLIAALLAGNTIMASEHYGYNPDANPYARKHVEYDYEEDDSTYEAIVPQSRIAGAIITKGEIKFADVKELFKEAGYVKFWGGMTDESIKRISRVLNGLYSTTKRAEATRHVQQIIAITALSTLQKLYPNVDFAKLYGFDDQMAWTDALSGKE